MNNAVIFDCFGVLYIDQSQSFYEQNVAEYDQLRPRLLELGRQSDYGFISQHELVEQVAELIDMPRSEVQSGIIGKHQKNDVLLDFIADLRQRGVLVGMLSNIGPAAMDGFFSPRERQELFDAVVLSGEEMMTKPHPEIYRLTAERLGTSPQHCLMIDDDENNCAGADAAGMEAVRFETTSRAITAIEEYLKKSA